MSAASTSSAVRIERGGSRDLDSLMRIMDAAFDPRFGEAWTRSQCGGILPMKGVELLIARKGEADQPSGFALCRMVADDAELLLLAVDPSHRRQGIGSRLLEQFIDRARGHGASRVHLEVREGNPAIKLYRSAGFAIAGRRRKYYRGSDGYQYDALTLARLV
ncbi:MAG TPA: ribosomal protein S18-alanine N-acetyltransferase [Sphingomicrobium sp.]|nr:ribosomal protein S18-alanine N-acetyltransferase [Sphingomicrobium sp.]